MAAAAGGATGEPLFSGPRPRDPKWEKATDILSYSILALFLIAGLTAITAYTLNRYGQFNAAKWTAVGAGSCVGLILFIGPFLWWVRGQR